MFSETGCTIAAVSWPRSRESAKTDGPMVWEHTSPDDHYYRFKEHVESLPTVEDLFGDVADHPEFLRGMAEGREEEHSRLLAEVEAGEITRLAAERIIQGLTQAELADRAGLSQPAVARLERIDHNMSPRSAKRVAEALGIEDWRIFLS